MPPDLKDLVHHVHSTITDMENIKIGNLSIRQRILSFSFTAKLFIAIVLMDGLIYNIAMYYWLKS